MLAILLLGSFSLLFINVCNEFKSNRSSNNSTAAYVYDFDSGYLVRARHGFWQILGNAVLGIPLSTTESQWYYNSYNEFEIDSITGLNNFAASVAEGFNFAGKTVKLTADLNYKNKVFIPIGFTTNENDKWVRGQGGFNGTFDGGGHVVSNIKIESSKIDTDTYLGTSYPCSVGFFSYLGDMDLFDTSSDLNCQCVVKSLQVQNMDVTIPSQNIFVGGIAGSAYMKNIYTGVTTNKTSVTIENCILNNLKVVITSHTGFYSGIGGLVGGTIIFRDRGNPEYLKIKNCMVNDMYIQGAKDAYDSISVISPAAGILNYYNVTSPLLWYSIEYCITNNYYDYDYPHHAGKNIPTICAFYSNDPDYTTVEPGSIYLDENTYALSSASESVEYVIDGNNLDYWEYSFGDYDKVINYDSDDWDITGGYDMFLDYDYNSNPDSPWFAASYKASWGSWEQPSDKSWIYLTTFLTEATFETNVGKTSLSTALITKGYTVTEGEEISTLPVPLYKSTSTILNVDLYYIDSDEQYFWFTEEDPWTCIDSFCNVAAVTNEADYVFEGWELDHANYKYEAIFERVITTCTLTFDENSYTDKTISVEYIINIGTTLDVTITNTTCTFTFKDKDDSLVAYVYTLDPELITMVIVGCKIGDIESKSSSYTLKINKDTNCSPLIEIKSYKVGFGGEIIEE